MQYITVYEWFLITIQSTNTQGGVLPGGARHTACAADEPPGQPPGEGFEGVAAGRAGGGSKRKAPKEKKDKMNMVHTFIQFCGLQEGVQARPLHVVSGREHRSQALGSRQTFLQGQGRHCSRRAKFSSTPTLDCSSSVAREAQASASGHQLLQQVGFARRGAALSISTPAR